MQNRFCLCGYKIIVDYLSQRGQWKPYFVVNGATVLKRHRSAQCPNCGSHLNINTLR